MYVVNRDDLNDTERDVKSETWRSRRMVLGRERVGFSFHDTVIYAGTTSTFHYQNHVEAVYCVQGKGTLTDEETGKVYPLHDGVMYMLDGHEKHTVVAEEELRMACVFNPPVTGREVHDENGVYPLIVEDEAAPAN
jgi:L-ectoine synthase